MKRFQEYINEQKTINEGLIGDIIRKLLDTGLSWIEKSVAWMANSFKAGIYEGWSSFKQISANRWQRYSKSIGYYGERPTTERGFYSFLSKELINKKQSMDEKYKHLLKIKEYWNINDITFANIAVTVICADASKKNSTEQEKRVAIKYLRKIQDDAIDTTEGQDIINNIINELSKNSNI